MIDPGSVPHVPHVPHVVRAASRADDARFILASWGAQLRQLSPWRHYPDVMDRYRDRVIVPLVERSDRFVVTAPDDDDQILGYAIWSPHDATLRAVHMLYVRDYYRHRGLGRMLVALVRCAGNSAATVVYTHQTKAAPEFAKRTGMRYWPQLAVWRDPIAAATASEDRRSFSRSGTCGAPAST